MEVSTLCRICLEAGGTIPLFEENSTEDSVLCKLVQCVNETVEDVEGFPRNICTECSDSLLSLYEFYKKYKQSSELLHEISLTLKTENNDSDDSKTEVNGSSDNVECINEQIISDCDIKDEVNEESDHDDEKIFNSEDKTLQQNVELTETVYKGDSSVKMDKQKEGEIKENRKRTNNKLKGIEKLPDKIIVDNNTPKKSKSKKKKSKKMITITIMSKADDDDDHPVKPTEENNQPSKPTGNLCETCGMVFKQPNSLINHINQAHLADKDKNMFECLECSRKFTTQDYLRKHTKRQHMPRQFACSVCGKCFAYGRDHKIHVNTHNKTQAKKLFQCKLCDKKFVTQKYMIAHERSAHTGERPAACTVCGSTFYHEDYLKEHMRLHTGETPFKCPICGRGYAQSGNMKSHVQHNHKLSDLDEETIKKLRPSILKRMKT